VLPASSAPGSSSNLGLLGKARRPLPTNRRTVTAVHERISTRRIRDPMLGAVVRGSRLRVRMAAYGESGGIDAGREDLVSDLSRACGGQVPVRAAALGSGACVLE
jgi:hypothetical protein